MPSTALRPAVATQPFRPLPAVTAAFAGAADRSRRTLGPGGPGIGSTLVCRRRVRR